MKEKTFFLCGRCACDLAANFNCEIILGRDENKACDVCHKKRYGRYYRVSEQKKGGGAR